MTDSGDGVRPPTSNVSDDAPVWTVEHDSRGLTAVEVSDRIADGRVNHLPAGPGRTTTEIIRANVLTPINAIVGVLVVLVVVANGVGPDMLFGLVIVSNSLIGIIQELRARSTLERLAVLSAPRVVARRDGRDVELGVEDVVADDLLILTAGAQVVVDGDVVSSSNLELNESLLTGESDPQHKAIGDQVLSGSFVAAGSGTYRATKIGGESFAASLAAEARKFTLVRSELRDGINRILKVLMVIVPIVAAVLLWRSLAAGLSFSASLSGMVASSVAMVPDGLVLLTSGAFMAGVVTLARKGALLEELASVELLARVDTLCLDKTGTITTGEISFAELVCVGGNPDDAALRLGALAASDPDPNATLAAIGVAFDAVPGTWSPGDSVPFASARKWSATEFSGPDSMPAVYLGAPEFLLAGVAAAERDRVMAIVEPQADAGRRVVLMAAASRLTGE
ncbi:MAG: HAD-IC family P-type ATPase, partial [Actinomycetes bacterium]